MVFDMPKQLRWRPELGKSPLRIRAMRTIANFRGREEICCMIDLTPEATCFGAFKLIDVPCAGPLEIDHILGAERGDRGRKLYYAIVDGKRILDALRVLCWVHNRLYRAQWKGVYRLP